MNQNNISELYKLEEKITKIIEKYRKKGRNEFNRKLIIEFFKYVIPETPISIINKELKYRNFIDFMHLTYNSKEGVLIKNLRDNEGIEIKSIYNPELKLKIKYDTLKKNHLNILEEKFEIIKRVYVNNFSNEKKIIFNEKYKSKINDFFKIINDVVIGLNNEEKDIVNNKKSINHEQEQNNLKQNSTLNKRKFFFISPEDKDYIKFKELLKKTLILNDNTFEKYFYKNLDRFTITILEKLIRVFYNFIKDIEDEFNKQNLGSKSIFNKKLEIAKNLADKLFNIIFNEDNVIKVIKNDEEKDIFDFFSVLASYKREWDLVAKYYDYLKNSEKIKEYLISENEIFLKLFDVLRYKLGFKLSHDFININYLTHCLKLKIYKLKNEINELNNEKEFWEIILKPLYIFKNFFDLSDNDQENLIDKLIIPIIIERYNENIYEFFYKILCNKLIQEFFIQSPSNFILYSILEQLIPVLERTIFDNDKLDSFVEKYFLRNEEFNIYEKFYYLSKLKVNREKIKRYINLEELMEYFINDLKNKISSNKKEQDIFSIIINNIDFYIKKINECWEFEGCHKFIKKIINMLDYIDSLKLLNYIEELVRKYDKEELNIIYSKSKEIKEMLFDEIKKIQRPNLVKSGNESKNSSQKLNNLIANNISFLNSEELAKFCRIFIFEHNIYQKPCEKLKSIIYLVTNYNFYKIIKNDENLKSKIIPFKDYKELIETCHDINVLIKFVISLDYMYSIIDNKTEKKFRETFSFLFKNIVKRLVNIYKFKIPKMENKKKRKEELKKIINNVYVECNIFIDFISDDVLKEIFEKLDKLRGDEILKFYVIFNFTSIIYYKLKRNKRELLEGLFKKIKPFLNFNKSIKEELYTFFYGYKLEYFRIANLSEEFFNNHLINCFLLEKREKYRNFIKNLFLFR
ncbi:MAG: hypothetical protein ACTSPY_04065 [Candidatus Helarchaeota archaeon]